MAAFVKGAGSLYRVYRPNANTGKKKSKVVHFAIKTFKQLMLCKFQSCSPPGLYYMPRTFKCAYILHTNHPHNFVYICVWACTSILRPTCQYRPAACLWSFSFHLFGHDCCFPRCFRWHLPSDFPLLSFFI